MRALLISIALISGSSAVAASSVPVVIGGSPDVDACTSLGTVTSKEAVALRAGPGEQFQRIATLTNGDFIHLCSNSADGTWTGVVLAQDGILDCGVSSPVTAAQPYNGPCVSGWVPTKWVSPVAG